MIKRYRVQSQLENYKASFEMIFDDQEDNRRKSLHLLRNLISKYEQKYISHDSYFRETFREVEVVGNSVNDLNTKDFRTFIMIEAICHRFSREDKVIESTYFIEKPIDIKDDAEYSEYIEQWREEDDQRYLKLAGLSLTDTKPKRRRKKAVV